jgi:hypothetical protein
VREKKTKKKKNKKISIASWTGLILKRKREERDCGKRDDNEVEDDES